MKNIAILIPGLYGGGAERIAGVLSKYLSSRYNVYLLMKDVNKVNYEYGGCLVDISYGGEECIITNLIEAKKKYHIDCAISFLTDMNFYNIITRQNEKVIVSERNSLYVGGVISKGDLVRIERLYNLADKVVSVSYGVEQELIHKCHVEKNLLKTIYNFINKDEIYFKSQQPVEKDIIEFIGDSRLILAVGRLEQQKNHIKLLIQFSKLIQERIDVKLIIIGTGNEESELRKLVKELKLEEYVRFITYNSNPFPIYKMASIMALTSDYEGLPNVLLEAMSLKVPIVAVDCRTGPRELLARKTNYYEIISEFMICENGILVEQTDTDTKGDTNYFMQALSLLLDDEQLSNNLAMNAYQYMQEYSNEKILNQWMDVIENTLKKEFDRNLLEISDLHKYKKVIIYGAGLVGKQILHQIEYKKLEFVFLCFAVTDKSGVDNCVYNVPVYQIEELIKYKEDALVIVGVSLKYEEEIVKHIEKLGFHYVYANFC